MRGSDAAARPALVIGGGVAGLSAAVRLSAAGRAVTLLEMARHLGGRCRSFDDAKLGARIDNGNHLMMTANQEILDYLDMVGARDEMKIAPLATFPFIDLAHDRRWIVRIRGKGAWWALDPRNRVPGTGIGDVLDLVRMARASDHQPIGDLLRRRGQFWRRFWEPLAVGALNVPAVEGDAGLLRAVIERTFLAGEAACRPMTATRGLSETFVDPAVRFLTASGARLRLGAQVKALRFADGSVAEAVLDDGAVLPLAGADVVLAMPPTRAMALAPGLTAPAEGYPIVNVHFRLDQPAPTLPDGAFLMGLVGSQSQWIFVREEIVSHTISAAAEEAKQDEVALVAQLWRETCQALRLGPAARYAAVRVIREKRATFLETPPETRKRPGPQTVWRNLFLAGDWTATGLPATIEGAVLSGRRAAAAAMGRGG